MTPQMAPLSWLTLFLYFTLTFALMNPLNYFLCLKPMKKIEIKSESKSKLNWKW